MKKMFALLLGFGLLFTTTGCFDIVEEIFLNKNGSGKYLVTMDMSAMFSDPFMKSMMEESLKEETGATELSMEKDTTIFFRDVPEAADLSAAERQLIQNALMKLTMSEEKGQMLIRMELPFNNIEDINKIGQVMDKIGASQQMGGLGGGMMTGSTALFAMKKNTLTRLPAPKAAPTEDEEESMEMMKMFLGEAKYTTIYHLPGKVRKAGIPGAKVEGDKVTVSASLLDMMDGKAKIEGDIRFK